MNQNLARVTPLLQNAIDPDDLANAVQLLRAHLLDPRTDKPPKHIRQRWEAAVYGRAVEFMRRWPERANFIYNTTFLLLPDGRRADLWLLMEAAS